MSRPARSDDPSPSGTLPSGPLRPGPPQDGDIAAEDTEEWRDEQSAMSWAAALVDLLALAVAAFGIVLGFNQLTTQSPIDAILPVALFTVGAAGVLWSAAAFLGERGAPSGDEPGRVGEPAGRDAPPFLAMAVPALAAVLWRWGVTAQAVVVGTMGLYLLLSAGRDLFPLLVGPTLHRPGTWRVGTDAALGLLLVGFAVAALVDAGIRPFS